MTASVPPGFYTGKSQMAESRLYALVHKSPVQGAAWLVHLWDGDTDFYAAFTSRRHAETWLTVQADSLPKPERSAPNQYYYEWSDLA